MNGSFGFTLMLVVLAALTLMPVTAQEVVPDTVETEEPITEIHTDFTGEPFAGKEPYFDKYNEIFQEGGLLHFKQKKVKMEDGEWKKDWWIYRVEERVSFRDMTIDVEIGRLDGDGWAGGAAVVVFGARSNDDLYYFILTRTTQQWLIGKLVNGTYYAVFPPADSANEWDKGATINAPDLFTREAWDWVKIICESVPEGTRIAVYSKGVLLGETIDDTYQGGFIGLGSRTWGYSAHMVFGHLHVVPWIHYN